MDIDEFYDQDESRRASSETTYGIGWPDEDDKRTSYDIFWVHDTGELYSMSRPNAADGMHTAEQIHDDVVDLAHALEDMSEEAADLVKRLLHPHHVLSKTGTREGPGGSNRGHGSEDVYDERLQVEVLADIKGQEQVEAVLSGWQDALGSGQGISWVRQRIKSAIS